MLLLSFFQSTKFLRLHIKIKRKSYNHGLKNLFKFEKHNPFNNEPKIQLFNEAVKVAWKTEGNSNFIFLWLNALKIFQVHKKAQ